MRSCRRPTPSLRGDEYGLEIEVRVAHRVVYLSGTVKSRAEKAAAEHIAVTESGIAKVVSLLEVVPGGGGY